jgi:hypothetical protein
MARSAIGEFNSNVATEDPITYRHRPSKPTDDVIILMLIEKASMIGKIKKMTEWLE